MIIDVMGLPMFPNEFSEEQFKIAAKQYCSGNREKVIDLLDKMIPLYTTTFVNRDYFLYKILSVFKECMWNKEIWWFKMERDPIPTTKIEYMCVVVLLESILYWCRYNHNYYSKFDVKMLREILQRPLFINENFYLSEL